MSVSKELYIIRHGETDFNKRGIIQGSGVDSSLNATGRQQAELFHRAYHHLPFDRIYTSSLKRTIQSVHPFIDQGIPHTIMREFNEINWGIFEGKMSTPIDKLIYDGIVNDWKNGFLDKAVQGGETPNQLQKRQRDGLQKLLQAENDRLVLICMHGRAMRSFLSLLTGKNLSMMDEFRHSNLCLYVVQHQSNGRFTLKLQNNTDHLFI